MFKSLKRRGAGGAKSARKLGLGPSQWTALPDGGRWTLPLLLGTG